MAITLSTTAQTVSVLQINEWRSSRPSATQVYDIIGRGDPDVTLGPLGLRAGTLTLLCASLGEAAQMETHLATQGVQTLVDTEVPEVGMIFVVVGSVDVELDIETAAVAIVSFGYQEVIP